MIKQSESFFGLIPEEFQSKKSKMISNDQELIQSDPKSYPQNLREIAKYKNWEQFTKSTRGKPNEQLFPRQVVIQLPKIYYNMSLT